MFDELANLHFDLKLKDENSRENEKQVISAEWIASMYFCSTLRNTASSAPFFNITTSERDEKLEKNVEREVHSIEIKKKLEKRGFV